MPSSKSPRDRNIAITTRPVDNETDAAGPELDRSAASASGQKVINLALQGGGSHGAFVWGVLDRLLEDERLKFEAITASSAGAVNAVVLTTGLVAGGREGARQALRAFWHELSDSAQRGIFRTSLVDKGNPTHGLEHSLGYVLLEALTYFASPYQLNPLNLNPLTPLLERHADFDRIRAQQKIKLFLSTTNVRTAKVKVFNAAELTVNHVLASTCLPLMMHAIELDGQHYWDGGYAGNPAIFPIIYECEQRDILLVHTTPSERPEVPQTSPAIMNRMQEISFNTALIREMRTVAFLNRRIEQGKAEGKQMLVHVIEAEDLMQHFTASSRLNSDWDFLTLLFDEGRARADAWLKENFDYIGVNSTVDLEEKYF
ncbi:MAG: patatin-like phospholipase family protein [Hyphomicrobiales bacterium]|nr:patatin-like phospholipase family protein [Hyphomicrobiales bacterium]